LIDLAASKLSFENIADTAKILPEQALKLNPDSGSAKSVLAIALKALGQNEAVCDLMPLACNETIDSTAKPIAESFLSGKNIL
jgi:uncharacterized protein with PhoU and TrkA domain